MNSTTEEFQIPKFVFAVAENFELCLLLVSIGVFGCFAYVFTVAPLFHVNFIRLIEGLFLAFIVSTISRTIVLVGGIMGVDSTDYELNNVSARLKIFFISETFSCYSYTYAAAVILCIAVERSLATIMLKTYETWRSKRFTMLCVIFQLAFSSITTVGFYTKWVTLLSLCIIFIVCTLMFGGVLIFIDYWNKKCYKNLSSYTLSERFQIAENMRAAKIFKRTIFIITIGHSIIIPIFVILYFFNNESLLRRIIITLGHLLISAYKMTIAVIGITSTDIWTRILIKKFHVIKSKLCFKISPEITSSQIELLKYLKTSDGRRMTFTVNEERELYFKNLKNEWS